MATDAWQQARAGTVALWRRIHPEQADHVGAELEALRTRVLTARQRGDEDTEQALAGTWRLHLQQLLLDDPTLATELQRLLDEQFAPILPPGEQTRVQSLVMRAEARDNARVYMAGGDQHITGS